jgi:hypothetical protein
MPVKSLALLFSTALAASTAGALTLPGPAGTPLPDTGIHQAPLLLAEVKLPGGVSSRLKRIGKELDRADKALEKGAGSAADQARRAEFYLQKARATQAEIEKRYAGQFAPDHPEVAAVYGRLETTATRIGAALTAAARPEPTPEPAPAAPAAATAPVPAPAPAGLPPEARLHLAKLDSLLERAERALDTGNQDRLQDAMERAGPALEQLRARFPGDAPEITAAVARHAQLQQRAQQAGQAAAAAEDWAARLTPFVEGDDALLPYPTDDAALWDRWQRRHAEASALWEAYRAAGLSHPPGRLASLETQLERQLRRFEELYGDWSKQQAAAAALQGEMLFSSQPIDPAAPRGTTTRFRAGEPIYAHIRAKKTWQEIFGNPVTVMIETRLDGKKIHAQFITLKSPRLQNSRDLTFEIAPEASHSRAYGNPELEYGTSRAGLRQGPQELTGHLAALSPGRHRMDFTVQYYGQVYAQGGFDIEGDDFSYYAGLNQQAVAAAAGAVTLPEARMDNPGLVRQMQELLEAAGWSDIRQINIVDRDWWLERIDGGNTPVSARYLAAAVLARDGRGHYYKKVRFQQDRSLSGGFGALYISHTGERHEVPEANLGR